MHPGLNGELNLGLPEWKPSSTTPSYLISILGTAHVVYFDLHLGDGHSKGWPKDAKKEKRRKKQEVVAK